MTTNNSNIADAAKDVVIEHVDVAEGEAMKLIHFGETKFKVAEDHVVAFVKREAHDAFEAGDAVVEFGEEKFHIAEDRILAFLRLHEVKQPEVSIPAIAADPENVSVADPNADASKASV